MAEFSRILVVVTQQLGDVLLCTPLIHACRKRWPAARIEVLGLAGTLALLQGNPDVDGVVEVRRGGGWRQPLRDARRLWRRYDLALVTQAGDRAQLYGAVAAPLRSAVLPLTGPGRGWKRWLAQHGFVGQPLRHSVLEKLQLVSPWVDLTSDPVSLVPPAALSLPPALESVLRQPCVVVHVPSMWRYKQWPVAHFREVTAGLLADGVQVVLTGADNASDRALVAALRDLGAEPQLIDVCGTLSLCQVTTLLQRADAYLGPDTSVTHLAAAVGLPIVTLFGPTQPMCWGPWPAGHAAQQPWALREQRQQVGRTVLLQGPDLPDRQCVPCGRKGCDDRNDSASHCLEGLAPQRVLAELRDILTRQPR